MCRELVEKARNGNVEAFGELVKRYKDAVYGVAYSKVGNFHDAPDNFGALKGLGMCYLELGWRLGNDRTTIEKAIPFLSKALQLQPDDLTLRKNLANAYGTIGEDEKRIELCGENVKRAPDQAWTHLQLAWAYNRDIQKRREELEKCLALSPEAPAESRARLSLARIYLREGTYEDAEQLLAKALDLPLEPFHRAEIHAHLAEALAYQGKTDRCIEHVRRTVVMDEGNRWREFFRTRTGFERIKDNEKFTILVEPDR